MTRHRSLPLIALLLAGFFFVLTAAHAQRANSTLQVWDAGADMRLTPASMQTGRDSQASAEAFRNEIISMQFAARADQMLKPFKATCGSAGDASAKALPCSWVEIRYPGYVPVVERGELMADPLLTSPPAEIKANWTQGIWLTISVPADASPGDYNGALEVEAGSERKQLERSLRVLDFTLPGMKQGDFYLNIWQDPAAVARVAKVPLWSPEHWKLLEAYTQDLAAHGQRSISASIVYDPWRSQTGFVYPSMVEWRFPGE